jgi:hypothetical protein
MLTWEAIPALAGTHRRTPASWRRPRRTDRRPRRGQARPRRPAAMRENAGNHERPASPWHPARPTHPACSRDARAQGGGLLGAGSTGSMPTRCPCSRAAGPCAQVPSGKRRIAWNATSWTTMQQTSAAAAAGFAGARARAVGRWRRPCTRWCMWTPSGFLWRQRQRGIHLEARGLVEPSAMTQSPRQCWCEWPSS